MTARREDSEDIGVGDDGRNGKDPAAEGLAQAHRVGAHSLVVTGEAPARPAETGLDLVGDHQDVVPRAQFPDRRQVALAGYVHPGLSLDRLEEDGHGVFVDRFLDRGDVVEGDDAKTRGVRPEALTGVGVGAERDDRDRAPVEVLRTADDFLPAVDDALFLDAPQARHLEGGLHRLRAGVHRQGHRESGVPAEFFQELSHPIVVECATGERHPVGLFLQGTDDPGVTVPLVHRRIRREEVHVATPLGVLDPHAFGGGDDHRQGMVVVGSDAFVEGDDLLGAGGAVDGGHGLTCEELREREDGHRATSDRTVACFDPIGG